MKDIATSKPRWVIPISDEKSAIAALVLTESLKRVHTIGLIAGLIESGSNICDRIRGLLRERMSEVVEVSYDCKMANSIDCQEASSQNLRNSLNETELDAYCLALRNCDDLLMQKSWDKYDSHNHPVVGHKSAMFLENPSMVKVVRIDGIKISPYLSIYRTQKLASIFEQAIWDYWWSIYRLEVKPHVEGTDSPPSANSPKFDCMYNNDEPLKNVLLLSANSEEHLTQKLNTILEKLQNGTELDALERSISDSTSPLITQNGEPKVLNRMAVFGKDSNEMLQRIQENLVITPSPICNQKKKVCFIFTGQGCQYENMGKVLYESCQEYKFHVDYCYAIVLKKFGISLANIPKDMSKMSGYLQNLYSNLPTFIVQYSLFKTWEAWGVKPDYILSHSLGEFAGSVAAGFMTCEEGISLIVTLGKSARFLKQNASMVVMKADEHKAINLIGKFSKDEGSSGGKVEFVAINSHTQVVLAGRTEVIRKFVEWCSRKNISIRMFPSLLAFHTSMLQPIHHQQVKIAGAIQFKKPEPSIYISGMTGDIVENMDGVFWADHEEKTVQFMKGCETAFKKSCNVFLEIGPRPLLSSLVLSNKEHFGVDGDILCLPSLKQNEDDCSIMMQTLGHLFVNGINVDKSRFYHM